ncbi:unnamed protein product [Owenia fusiformis]|uniref:Uncharacterized protein n=1 Tax=Owenia fusiformis TaxID=6347 RepID=A0A8S4PHU7_OWEFU|nr:unnamed protein product [Owenia fusiformis]
MADRFRRVEENKKEQSRLEGSIADLDRMAKANCSKLDREMSALSNSFEKLHQRTTDLREFELETKVDRYLSTLNPNMNVQVTSSDKWSSMPSLMTSPKMARKLTEDALRQHELSLRESDNTDRKIPNTVSPRLLRKTMSSKHIGITRPPTPALPTKFSFSFSPPSPGSQPKLHFYGREKSIATNTSKLNASDNSALISPRLERRMQLDVSSSKADIRKTASLPDIPSSPGESPKLTRIQELRLSAH